MTSWLKASLLPPKVEVCSVLWCQIARKSAARSQVGGALQQQAC